MSDEKDMEARIAAALGVSQWRETRQADTKKEQVQTAKTSLKRKGDAAFKQRKALREAFPVVSNVRLTGFPDSWGIECIVNGVKKVYRDNIPDDEIDEVIEEIYRKFDQRVRNHYELYERSGSKHKEPSKRKAAIERLAQFKPDGWK